MGPYICMSAVTRTINKILPILVGLFTLYVRVFLWYSLGHNLTIDMDGTYPLLTLAVSPPRSGVLRIACSVDKKRGSDYVEPP